MTFFPNAPAPGDNISVSQGQLQSNNQFLASTIGNAANGSYTFPNGLIMQWGSKSISGAGTRTVSFLPAFTTAVYCIQITRTQTASPGASYSYFIDSSTVSTAGFTYDNSDGHSWGFYWFAIGV